MSCPLPDPDLVVAIHVRQVAVPSSRIEGRQSSLDDVLTCELDLTGRGVPRDVSEIVNYVNAMNHGLRRIASLPLSLRLIAEIHGVVLAGVREAARLPREIQTSQNWIGKAHRVEDYDCLSTVRMAGDWNRWVR